MDSVASIVQVQTTWAILPFARYSHFASFSISGAPEAFVLLKEFHGKTGELCLYKFEDRLYVAKLVPKGMWCSKCRYLHN